MIIKLNAAGQMARDAFKQMPTSIKVYQARIANPKIPEEDKVGLRQTVARMQKIVNGVKAYPASNLTFYQENEKVIAETLARFDQIHADAGEEVSKQQTPGGDSPAPGQKPPAGKNPDEGESAGKAPATRPTKPTQRRFSKPRPLPAPPAPKEPGEKK